MRIAAACSICGELALWLHVSGIGIKRCQEDERYRLNSNRTSALVHFVVS